jgi:toxin ParE1/3/4
MAAAQKTPRLMRFEVVFTPGAERDLEDIHDHIFENDSAANADRVLDRLIATAKQQSQQPQRGSIPRELQEIGIVEYRHVIFKPYRMIYRVVDRRAIVYLVADGRRDMQSLLARRLMSA